jgi:hypothetical protein
MLLSLQNTTFLVVNWITWCSANLTYSSTDAELCHTCSKAKNNSIRSSGFDSGLLNVMQC